MVGFTKLHAAILDSSIWLESSDTRIVWITLLAMANKDGIVEASMGGLAHRANVSIEVCRRSIEAFEGPDPDSRDGTTGERVEKVPGGWLILNHANYRDKQTREQAQTAERVRRHRESNVDVTRSNAQKRGSASASASEIAFEAFWEAFDRKVGKVDAWRLWQRLNPDEALAATIIEKAKAWKEATPDKQFRPYPTTWLNRRGWEDELPQPSTGRRPVAATSHIPNMPLGAPSCQCGGCVEFRGKQGRAAQ